MVVRVSTWIMTSLPPLGVSSDERFDVVEGMESVTDSAVRYV